jgi:hypothetical protein
MNFQKSLLVISIIVLILVLIFIGLALSKSKQDIEWPPIVGKCPDYWVDLETDGKACFNKHKLGKCNIPERDNKNTKNFNEPPFNSSEELCAKYKWASSCGVTWDGITYGVKNPCDSK